MREEKRKGVGRRERQKSLGGSREYSSSCESTKWQWFGERDGAFKETEKMGMRGVWSKQPNMWIDGGEGRGGWRECGNPNLLQITEFVM